MSPAKPAIVTESNLPTGGAPSKALLEIDLPTFRGNFNRHPFPVRHRLSDHPLFKLPELVELSRRLPENLVEYYPGDVPVSIDSRLIPRTGLSIQETIRRIEECRSWMVLKCAHQDPIYGELLDRCLEEIQPHSEPLAPGMCQRAAAVFIASPGAVTPYHMDHEINFLLQIRGSKSISIFDHADRSVVAEEEFERYFTGDRIHRNMEFKDEWQRKASVFRLTPGAGVHVPATDPHWVKNDDNVSISFAIYFLTSECDRVDAVHQTNACLRKLGLHPSPVGHSFWRDEAKYHGLRVFRRAQELISHKTV